jgi:exodeoxyribonuclease VII small subunit
MAEKEKNFEELMVELEDITNKLESDKLTLDESVKLFEQGMKVSKECNQKLESAEKKITVLLNADSDDMKEESFIPEE